MDLGCNSHLPISVQICTLNEEHNIKKCLDAVLLNCPAEVIVIDGGSHDNTVEIALKLGVKIINAGRVGLARQRQIGITSTSLPYIAIVDADDRIEKNCLKKLFKEIRENNFYAIQANVQSFSNETYWQKGWGIFCSVNINTVGRTNMVGRPALYQTDKILEIGFDPFFSYGSEDTDISYRFEKASYEQGIGTGISYRIHPLFFKECKKKWISYGRGYKRFVLKFPERKNNILRHLFINIPFKRTWNIIKEGYLKYSLFNILYAYYVIVGYYKESRVIKSGEFSLDLGR